MISDFMRGLLIVGGIVNLAYIIIKLRKVQIEVSEAVFWIWISLIIALMGVFPGIPISIAMCFGVEMPANLVYLFFIALLLIKLFLLSIKVSRLESQLKNLVVHMAVQDKVREDKG